MNKINIIIIESLHIGIENNQLQDLTRKKFFSNGSTMGSNLTKIISFLSLLAMPFLWNFINANWDNGLLEPKILMLQWIIQLIKNMMN